MSYNSILKKEIIETEIKKSRFIGYSCPVETEEEALKFVEYIKSENPQARHNCFAYIIGEKKLTQRYSDDGEPSGTAGIPILDIIKKKDITDICIVVTRYFGGILLGAGGLIRAYSNAANDVVNKSIIVEKKYFSSFTLKIDYNSYGRILNYLEENGVYIKNKQYEEDVSLNVFIEEEKEENLRKNLLDLTSGNIQILFNKKNLMNTINGQLYI
ncbi:YigZ family protein [Miniphocaeibacter massiliensis]|uniref:YigZ family protein n=1 Tax=Miniphocaeibacter massiliensis TaxID=2041841 RepID=UPI000C07C7DD|nr:YigZ family protein [Miniphocaeibacter massiliensis]